MNALAPARREGREAMERSLTPAERVRRQLKSGRKPRTFKLPGLLDAVRRLCEESDRGQSMMQKHGLSPDDIHLALVWRTARGTVGHSPLPPPGGIGQYVAKHEQVPLDFLGIMWWQTGPDTGQTAPMWITEFSADKRAALELLDYKNKLAKMRPQ